MISLRIMAECQQENSQLATIRVTLDSGTTADCIVESLTQKVGANISQNKMVYKLIDTQKKEIPISRIATLRIQMGFRTLDNFNSDRVTVCYSVGAHRKT